MHVKIGGVHMSDNLVKWFGYICGMICGWIKGSYRHSIYSLYTLAQPFIFPYTLGCMVARTTNA